jgi:hypothetical protein
MVHSGLATRRFVDNIEVGELEVIIPLRMLFWDVTRYRAEPLPALVAPKSKECLEVPKAGRPFESLIGVERRV